MRHSLLLELLFARDGMAPITIVWLVLGVIVGIARSTRWARFAWLPVFFGSLLGSIPVLMMLFAGGYALFGLIAWWAFPVVAVLLVLARPTDISTEPRGLVGVGGFVFAFIALLFVPRPNAIELRLRLVDGDGRPIGNGSFPISIYHGLGPNYDGVLKTDAKGLALLKVYYPESGSIKLVDQEDSRRNNQIQFEPWTPIVGGPIDGYRFDGKTEIAGNTDKEAQIVWSGRRDLKARKTEPMLTFNRSVWFEIPNEAPNLNVESGKFTSHGDVAFTATTGPGEGNYGPDIKLTVTANNGAGIALSSEQFMDVAPEGEYLGRADFVLLATDPHYAGTVRFRFYVRTKSGKYGVVGGEVFVSRKGNITKGYLSVGIRYTPGGSRNVEFDHKKWLNRDQL